MTGDSSVLALVTAAKKLEAVATVSRDDLVQRIEQFNLNRQGLIMSLVSKIYQAVRYYNQSLNNQSLNNKSLNNKPLNNQPLNSQSPNSQSLNIQSQNH